MLAAAFLSAMLAAGCGIHVFGLLVVAVTEEFGISRAEVNNGMIALMLGALTTITLSPSAFMTCLRASTSPQPWHAR